MLWVDCDRADSHPALHAFVPRPALAIASGSGGTHAYWPLADRSHPTPRARQPRVWPSALQADRHSVDAARILRPAGTLNHKHAPPRPVELRWFDEGAVVDSTTSSRRCPSCPGDRQRRRRRHGRAVATRAAIRCWPSLPPSTSPSSSGPPLNRDRKVSCPFHDDRTPSLHAFGRGLGWRCFGCGACGSIFDLAARLWGLRTRGRDFRELRRRLAEHLRRTRWRGHRAAGLAIEFLIAERGLGWALRRRSAILFRSRGQKRFGRRGAASGRLLGGMTTSKRRPVRCQRGRHSSAAGGNFEGAGA